ncbi:MAG: TIGR00282 family metallophosphoesterase, partial [Candidatus Portnoybacteria bacterium]
VGRPGRNAIKKVMPEWQRRYQPDLVIANGENIAHGSGITQKTLQELFDAGIDLVTSGDHVLKHDQVKDLLNNKEIPLIRPANFEKNSPGQGYYLIKVRTKNVLVINLIGKIFIEGKQTNPFKKIDQILKKADLKADLTIVDFHAEATAEKVCLGWYLDGRVSAVLGTHTHIPTADERILPQKTAYITDVGMVGVKDSSLGRDKDDAILRNLLERKVKMDVPEGPVEINAVLLVIGKNGRARKIQRIKETIV